MSIGKRITEAVDKMVLGDAEGALIPTCIAIAATAKKEYPSSNDNISFKKFVHDNFPLITKVAFGGTTIGNLRVRYNHPDIKTDDDGTCSFEQILYHVVRCGLVHSASFPSNLRFVKDSHIRVQDDRVEMPESIIYGLLAALVVSSHNKCESVPNHYGFHIGAKDVSLNGLWGNKDKLLEHLQEKYKGTTPLAYKIER